MPTTGTEKWQEKIKGLDDLGRYKGDKRKKRQQGRTFATKLHIIHVKACLRFASTDLHQLTDFDQIIKWHLINESDQSNINCRQGMIMSSC